MWKINSLYFKNVGIYWNKAVRRIVNVPYTTHTWMFFFEKIYFIQKKTNRQKKYIYTLQNLYTHTINIEHIIYMQESSGQPHIDQYRSKLYSLYTSNDRL